jgi:hypothetical protein
MIIIYKIKQLIQRLVHKTILKKDQYWRQHDILNNVLPLDWVRKVYIMVIFFYFDSKMTKYGLIKDMRYILHTKVPARYI